MPFSAPGVHRLTYCDDFWPLADQVRRELLEADGWMPMAQGWQPRHRFDRQNGLTLVDFERLPAARGLREHLHAHRRELCAHAGVDAAAADDTDVEMNAMAYGEGCWLSPHTDFQSTSAERRLVAWMLYLTHPDEGEWAAEDGGAVRLIERGKPETRLSPRFNRFAMFAVSDSSVHEIERVRRSCAWDRCRLALSGWFRGPMPGRHDARLFTKYGAAADAPAGPAVREGAAALARLLRAQRRYAGLDESAVDALLASPDSPRSGASADAPPGTVFTGYVPGPAWCIFVVDESGKLLFFGPRAEYHA